MTKPSFRLIQGGAGAPLAPDLRAAIFDMDGLLIDSEPLWRKAERLVFSGVGLELTDADCETTMGMRIDAVVSHWFERHSWEGPSLKEIEESIVCEVERLIEEEGRALPGVEFALEFFAGHGFRLGLASSSPQRLIDAVLERLELDGCFEVVRSATLEDEGKPHPAVYLNVARDLGVLPERCVALEDSVSGVRSALRAGMKVIAIPEREPAQESPLREAHLLLNSLAELRPEALELIPLEV